VPDITIARPCRTSRANGSISDMGHTDTHELARRLAALPAFGMCKTRDLEDLAARARHSSVPAGWPLIHEETPGDACYVLLEGTATVAIAGTPVATIEAGAIVGEMALAQGRLRNATVTSATPLDLLHIDATEFSRLLARRPALREALLARLNAVAATT
jgi:CRP-like cAMP-binding protein